MPENHDCPGLKAWKEKREDSLRWFNDYENPKTEYNNKNYKNRKRKKKFVVPKSLKYVIVGIFVIALLAIISFNSNNALNFGSAYNCTDGTPAGNCSFTKPLFCLKNGSLTDKPLVCGCPNTMKMYGDSCVTTCSDGTPESVCSDIKPLQCKNGTLIKKASACGCQDGFKRVEESCIVIQRCSDGTIYDECSSSKPLYCQNGILINKATKCGCNYDDVISGDSCISKYMTSPKTTNFEYVLRGSHSHISYTTYEGMSNYLSSLPRSISYYEDELPPTDKDFIMRELNDANQRSFINPLVEKIQSITQKKDDQARIAISLVQNINYDYAGLGTDITKYPYEVLYTGSGVCSEKSALLVYLLRELGFGVAIFRYNVENHDAVGIKCPQQYSHLGSGYCFVESTTPNIITDSSGDYVGAGKLTSTLGVITISDDFSFDSVSEEYNDAVAYNNILRMGQVLDEYNYNRWLSLVNKYGIKTE